MTERYIGLMSGTSLNGVDAVLVEFSQNKVNIIQTVSDAFPDDLFQDLQQLITSQQISLSKLSEIEHQLAVLYTQAVNQLVRTAGLEAQHITAIGVHGQTVYHDPDGAQRSTIQLCDPSYIAEHTGITVVSDFRRRDMAAGGQGAPLVPAFHAAMFRSDETDRVILNLGGIANITVLPRDSKKPVTGFDTGPGNTLIDQWAQQQQNMTFDKNGEWAATGNAIASVLNTLLADPYFAKAPPKSTGREYFNLAWLQKSVSTAQHRAQDIQATLLELTCQSIAQAIIKHAPDTHEIFVCGGGAHNGQLLQRLSQSVTPIRVQTTEVIGLYPDWVEAAAFAWLAKQTMHKQPGNITSVTGAKRAVILGAIYQA